MADAFGYSVSVSLRNIIATVVVALHVRDVPIIIDAIVVVVVVVVTVIFVVVVVVVVGVFAIVVMVSVTVVVAVITGVVLVSKKFGEDVYDTVLLVSLTGMISC